MTATIPTANTINSLYQNQEYWNKGGFVLCTAGSAEIKINEQIYTLTPGSVFVVTPLVKIFHLHTNQDYEQISMVCDLKVLYPIFQLISDTGVPLKISNVPCWKISTRGIEYVKDQYSRLIEKEERRASTESHEEQQMLTHLINLIRQESMLEIVSDRISTFQHTSDNKRNGKLVYGFILSLHENYAKERSVSWYASQANMSTGHFSSIIRDITGQSPSEWISMITTGYAKHMLEQTDKSIKEIADILNFPEQFTFRKYFKRYTGVSPTEYRKISRGS